MAFCTKCGAQLPDNSFACPNCGAPTAAAAPVMQPVAVDPYDHTKEMDKEDISSNKVFAVTASLLPAIPFILFYVDEIKVLFSQHLDWLQAFLGNYGSPRNFISTTILVIIAIMVISIFCKESKFVSFYTKQALKVAVLNLPLAFLSLIPFVGWTISFLIALFIAILAVIQCLSAGSGKAKEPAIIRGLPFLK